MLYRGMNRTQLDTAYNNTAAVRERDAIVAGWAARSARVRRERPGHLDLAYGDSPRERLDLFLAADPKAPTLAFIHGGLLADERQGRHHLSCRRRLAARCQLRAH
jgi:arylformamidase